MLKTRSATFLPKGSFSDIIGHQFQLEILNSHLAKRTLNHAYLFIGRENLGKTTIAWRLIAELLGIEDLGKLAEHPDLKVLDGSKVIKVDEIRALKHYLHLRPYFGDYKVAFIPEASRMNNVAANAFLKILEEPPGKSILILTASSEKNLLATITSRCQIFNFYPVDAKQLEGFLRQKGIGVEKASAITYSAQGRPGKAMRYLQNPEILEQEIGSARDLLKLSRSSLAQRFNFAKNDFDTKTLEQVLPIWLALYRDVLLCREGCQDLIATLALKKEILALSKKYTVAKLREIIILIYDIQHSLKNNINKRLALEVLLLHL